MTRTTAVLRLSEADTEADRTWIPDDLVDAAWRKGDRLIGGRIAQSSGVNLLLGEGDEPADALSKAMARLKSIATRVRMAIGRGTEATLDVAIYVDEERPMISTSLSQADLRVLEEIGVDLMVTAYLSSVEPSSG